MSNFTTPLVSLIWCIFLMTFMKHSVLEQIYNQRSVLGQLEYLELDSNFNILNLSVGVQRFTDFPKDLVEGKDVRCSFPEFIGIEDTLTAIIEGQLENYEITGIARSFSKNSQIYIDIIVVRYEQDSKNSLIVFIKDATEKMVLLQTVKQKAYETNLLLTAATACHAYIDKVISFMADALVVTTASGKIKIVNRATQELFGYSDLELINQPITQIIHSKDFFTKANSLLSLPIGESLKNIEVICKTRTGKEIIVAFSCSTIWADIGNIQEFVYIGRDITENKRLEQELFQEKELAQVTLKSIADAVITTDANGYLKSLNPVAEALTNYIQENAQGRLISELFKIKSEVTQKFIENPITKALRQGITVSLAGDSILITHDCREIAIDNSAAPIRDRCGKIIGAVLVFQDVSDSRRIKRQLSWQASHDSLTGLFNRNEFENRLEKTLKSAKAQNHQHVLCYLDLDRFKIVNDSCGHTAGDELLRQVTILFQSQVRSSDTLARLGGDEFGIILHRCSLDAAERVVNRLRECIQDFRFVWEDKTFKIGVSIGLVGINGDSQNLMTVLNAADAACYTAKNKGRNRVHIYQADDGELAQFKGQAQWVGRINQALEDNRFCLHFQRIVSINQAPSFKEHYEVLVRLVDETGNLVPPMAFIPAAERYNLMQSIDRWVIRTLFTSIGEHYRENWQCLQAQGQTSDCLYAINLSGDSINDDQLIHFLNEQLALHQIPPSAICFEITETVAIANLGKAAQIISSLKDLGFRFALDDFGSGMSSFAYLKNLPVDYLKIDGAFIKHIVNEPMDLAIVEAINQIGHVMGIQTIAEFVENDEILQKIKAIGVDYAQGYGIGKPHPLIFEKVV